MDTQSQYATKLLKVMATNHRRFDDFARQLRSRSEVSSVVSSLHPQQYSVESMLECYVDAELVNGKAICWWLEVTWDNTTWHIETRVLVNDEQGQYTIKEFPDRATETFDGFLEQFTQATVELLANEEAINLASRHNNSH